MFENMNKKAYEEAYKDAYKKILENEYREMLRDQSWNEEPDFQHINPYSLIFSGIIFAYCICLIIIFAASLLSTNL